MNVSIISLHYNQLMRGKSPANWIPVRAAASLTLAAGLPSSVPAAKGPVTNMLQLQGLVTAPP